MFHIDGIKMGWGWYWFIFQPLLWSSLFFNSMPIGFNKRGISSRSILGHWDAPAGPWSPANHHHLTQQELEYGELPEFNIYIFFFFMTIPRKSMVNPHFIKCYFLRLGFFFSADVGMNFVKWWIVSLPGCAAKSLFCFVIFVTPLKIGESMSFCNGSCSSG